jgi:DNA-binding IclR family transcriptional regulator
MNSAQETGSNDGTVRVLARGLRILKSFTPRNDWLSNGEIADIVGLPKPTVSRITAALTSIGYLTYEFASGRYRLAPPVLALGYMARVNLGIPAIARPLMQALANEHNALVVLAEQDGMSMVCDEVCHSNESIVSLRVHRGSRLTLPFSAAGRAYLGSLLPAERDKLCMEIATRFPQAWDQVSEGIKQATKEITERGFCVTMESLERGVNGVGVSIDLPNASNRYVLGCAAPAFHFTREHLEEVIGPAMLVVKLRIESSFNPALQPKPA